ncbi:hypothetical protein Bca4012_064160 [Brassica carinata]
MSYNTSISIFNRSNGAIGNGLNESTPQIQFESGLPFMIPFAMRTEMSAETIQSIQIQSMLRTYTSNKLDKNKPYGNLFGKHFVLWSQKSIQWKLIQKTGGMTRVPPLTYASIRTCLVLIKNAMLRRGC